MGTVSEPSYPGPPAARLPRELTSFVGRERELDDVGRRLRQAPLVTITGPGGVGKTRLALQLARRFSAGDVYADGVILVELAPVTAGEHVPRALADALAVVQQSGESVPQALVRYLQPRQVLVVLDNCEHVVAAAAQLAEQLLVDCPRLVLLATSREPLGVAGEVVFRIPPLGLPAEDGLAALAVSEAGHLFDERARAASSAFELGESNAAAVAGICRRLDGLPLAIELAAARVATLSVADIGDRLDDALRVVDRGPRTAPARQRTLHAAIAWSYELLDPAERRLFQRLAVFAGGFTLEGAQAVADVEVDALDVLPRLVAKSMVQLEAGAARYRLLEPLRQFARERLVEAGELGLAQQRHAAYVVELCERAERDYDRPALRDRLHELDVETANIAAALEWAIGDGQVEPAARLGASLWLWLSRPDRQTRARAWLERIAGLPGIEQHPFLHGRVVGALALVAVAQSDLPAGADLSERARRLAEADGDEWLAAMALALRGRVTALLGRPSDAARLLEEAIERARRAGIPWIQSRALDALGHVALAQGDLARAEACIRDSLRLARDRLDPWSSGQALNSLGDVLRARGDVEGAAVAYAESGVLFESLATQPYSPPALLHNQGYVALASGDTRQAARRFLESAALYRAATDDRRGLAECIVGLGCVAVRAGQAPLAACLFGWADASLEELGAPLMPANAADYRRALEALRALLTPAALQAAQAEGRQWSIAEALAAARDLAVESSAKPTRVAGLTPREHEVALLVARGLSNRELAEELVITEKTAKNHVQRVLDKLGVRSRTQIAARADELGLRGGPAR
jgi:predicted ATPase/DNA-binding CsgD family transcriptional regulator